jgi:hypothetical protein
MHTFVRIKDGDGGYLYVVGGVLNNEWHPLRDCNSAAEAAMFVSYLNGGERPPIPWGE